MSINDIPHEETENYRNYCTGSPGEESKYAGSALGLHTNHNDNHSPNETLGAEEDLNLS